MEGSISGTSSPTESEESSSNSNGNPSKRDKRKSKVWEKVVWFTRKSKSHKEETVSEIAVVPDENSAAFPGDVMDYDMAQSPVWTESGSSSDTENFEPTSLHKRSLSYPNSEIIEQHCLKPSVARALFQRMEASNMYPKPKRLDIQNSKGKRKNLYHFNFDSEFNPNSACAIGDFDNLPSTSNCYDFNDSSNHEQNENSVYSSHRICSCQETSPNIEDEISDCIAPITRHNIFDHHLCKKRPMLGYDGECSISSKKRSSFSSLRDLYDSQNTNSLFSSLPSHYGSRIKSAHQQAAKRPHLCIRSELLKDTKVRICTLENCSGPSAICTNRCSVKSEESKTLPQVVVPPAEFREKMNSMKQWFGEFSDEQRNIFLKDILGQCDLPQIHLLSLEMEPRMHSGCPPNCRDLITWLPATISLYILSFLDPVSLCQASAVCKVWNSLANDPCLWQRFCCQNKWRLSHTGEQKQVIHHMLPDGNIHWKKLFAERFRLRNNWLQGKCQVRTFEGHTQGISCVQFDDTRIVSGSSDKSIKVWNIRTNTPWSVQTLVGHSGTVRCLHLDGNRLVSGSTDCTIKVWDLSMQQSWSSIACKVTMTGHVDTVRCLQVDDEKIISGSYDKTLKVWDMRTGDCRMTLRGHDGAVLCVQFDENKIISGSSDKTIKLWNFSGDCLMTLQAHQDAVTCLQFDKTRIISGSLDCNLKFWDINTGYCVNTIDWKASEGHTGVVRCLQADRWRVVSASDDRTIKVWNLETGERLVTLRNHSDGVTCLQFNDSIIVSGSYDKTVKLWDFSCC